VIRAARRAAVALAVAVACTSPLPPPILAPGTPPPDAPRLVTVTVLGHDGFVEGADVCGSRPGREERCARSDANGHAVLELTAGTYAIRGTPPQGSRLEEGVVTIEIGTDPRVTLVLRGRSTISGVVRDPEGRAVRGAEACAHSTTSAEAECARTSANGTYTILIPPGVHKVEYTGPADGSRLMPQWARGRLSSAEAEPIDTRTSDVAGVDVTLARGVVLTGTVTAERDGRPIEAAQLCTYPLSAPLGWTCTTTDRRGRFIALREPGTYWVWAIPPDQRGTRLIPVRYDQVLLGVDATPFQLLADARVDMAFPEGHLVTGRVTSAGAPVVFAFVCIDTPFPTGRICRATADDGTYEIATRPDTYVLSVSPPAESDVVAGYHRGPVPDWTQAERVPVRGDTRVDIDLPRGVILAGRVLDPRGIPVESATLNVNDATGPRFFAVTDMHGHYSVAVLPGTYTVDVFTPRAYYLQSVNGTRVTVDADTGYDVVLPDVVVEPEP
jgi:hypothetical protein